MADEVTKKDLQSMQGWVNAERKKDAQTMQTWVAAELKKLETDLGKRGFGKQLEGERALAEVLRKAEGALNLGLQIQRDVEKLTTRIDKLERR